MTYVWSFIIAAIVMGAIDAVWIGRVANKFYKSQIGSLLRPKPDMTAAVTFYVLYVVGMVTFVIVPAIDRGSWLYALGYGGLYGLVTYATYDLTNLATLKGFTRRVVVVDMIWGVCLSAVVSAVTYIIVS